MSEQINKDELLANPIHHFAEWVVLNLIETWWKKKHGEEFPEFENLCKKDTMQITFQVNGIDLPFLEAMQELEKQLDREVASAAADYLAEKFSDKINAIRDIVARAEMELNKRVSESLGIEIEDDEED